MNDQASGIAFFIEPNGRVSVRTTAGTRAHVRDAALEWLADPSCTRVTIETVEAVEEFTRRDKGGSHG